MHNLNSGLTLGILGGGQLGRMSAMAAARLGISVVIFCPEKNAPASQVSKETIVAEYDDKDALKRFSEITDFISYEFENIPVETIDYLEELKQKSVLPDKRLLHVSQDRIEEKTFANNLDIETTKWTSVSTLDEIKNTLKNWNAKEFILKTTRFGYDGKGQIKCSSEPLEKNTNLLIFLDNTKQQKLILEQCVNFTSEISVIIARDKKGKTETYGPIRNEHKNHILHKTYVPAEIDENIAQNSLEIAKKIADHVDLVGILTVEFFVCDDGRILLNEIAPRTHNSGHWTIDSCAVSQFENHVRAVCGLPIGPAERHSDAIMLNLIGSDVEKIKNHIEKPDTCVHLYGKAEIREGRKMGHITFLSPNTKTPEDE